MTAPLLTIGMAHHQDFAGLWSTIQSIRINNLSLNPQLEIVVVNNSAEDEQTAQAIRGLLGVPSRPDLDYTLGVPGLPGNGARSKYVELRDTKGTSASRNKIFEHATGQYVIAMDCHLELTPQTIPLILKHYEQDPESRDILTGPLLLDNLQGCQTHFRDAWDDGMWGQWSTAWKCPCSREGSIFDLELITLESGTRMAMPRRLAIGNIPLPECEHCHKPIPDFTWDGHEAKYRQRGYEAIGMHPGPAFEIPGQGLGFFSCRRDAWLGFNRDAKAFGAEELCIHEKYRKAGHKALCIPGALWCHRFFREGGHRYPNTIFDKARNYVLWFQELGLDLAPVKRHFVDLPVKSALRENPPREIHHLLPETWEQLADDPVNTLEDPGPRKLQRAQALALLPELTNLDDIFNQVQPIPRDLNEHMPAFRALAELAGGSIVELTNRRESTLAFLAARPKLLTSYTSEIDAHIQKAAALIADDTRFNPRQLKPGAVYNDLPENDLLFIDTKHTYQQLAAELAAYAPKSRRFIVLHDTEIFGERGEDGQLGLKFAIAEHCDQHQQWAVIDHTTEQHGLTVLSCNLEDRPETPITGFNIPHGPGTELKKILSALSITPGANCGCNKKAQQMDAWGIEGCEDPAHFVEIVGWIRDGTWTGLDLASALARSFFTGIAFELNPLNPFESLVKLAIKRARETAAKRETK
jgi:glycosyltransferase involved in cell wall biosynthesis